MKDKTKKIISIIMFMLILITNIEVNALSVTATLSGPQTLKVGESAKVEVELVGPGTKKVIKWISNDNEVVKCNNNQTNSTTITALKAGTAKIIVTYECTNKGTSQTKTKSLEVTVISNSDENTAEESIEDTLRDNFGLGGYHEVYLRNYTKDELVDMIIERRYNSFTNNDNPENELMLIEKQFDYTGSVSWQDNGAEQVSKVLNLTLKCINETGSSMWHVGEEWEFNYEFHYLPEKDKICFQYSMELVKDADGNKFTDSTTSSDRFNDRSENANKTVNKILAAISSVTGNNRTADFEFKDVLTEDYEITDEEIPTEFISEVNVILTVITNIGMVVSILIIAVLGIKYMLGSVEEKADYKKDMIPYVVGAILLFGITAIVKIVQEIGESFNNI